MCIWSVAGTKIITPSPADATLSMQLRCPPQQRSGVDANAVRTPDEGTGIQDTFEKIYKKKVWGDLGGGSGSGSTLFATATTRILLEFVIHKYGITSITDAPCGSMLWMSQAISRIAEQVPCLRYTGVDVARSIVATAAEIHGSILPEGQMSFLVWDLSAAPLPADATHELVVCRDALQHLSFKVVGVSSFCLFVA